jgi:hypothetical protein
MPMRRTGVAAILVGALIFAGHGGELVFGSSGFLKVLFPILFSGGVIALAVALWGLRRMATTRVGRVGVRLMLAGLVFLALFAVHVLVEVIRSGDIPENFVLFALGFLLLLVGQLLLARDLRHSLGWAWVLPLVAVVGLILALAGGENPVHDIGLFVFEGAWVVLGVALLLRERAPT